MNKKCKSKAAIETEIRQHVAAEERAYRWVEKLSICDQISRDEMVQMINEILPPHYHDITEERSISMVCGYPLCNNKLLKASPQKYHISIHSNKVYDLSERKFFCSSYCFKASKYIEMQIPNSPLWLRTNSSTTEINFLEKEVKSPGLVTDSSAISFEMEKVQLDDIENIKIEQGAADDINPNVHYNDLEESVNEFDEFSKEKSCNLRKTKLITGHLSASVTVEKEDFTVLLNRLLAVIKEWFNQDSYKFLKPHISTLNKPKLSLKPGIDADHPNTHSNCNDKDKNTEQFRKNVAQFLSKNPEWVSETRDTEIKESALPPVDYKGQILIRRKIVKEKIYSSLDKISSVLHVTSADCSQYGFNTFIDTFRFSNLNIVLKSKEWVVMSLLLLKIFSTCSDNLAFIFSNSLDDLNGYLTLHDLGDTDAINEAVDQFRRDVLFEEVDEMNEDNEIVPDSVIANSINELNPNTLSNHNKLENALFAEMEELD